MTSTRHGSSKIGIIGQGSVGTAISEGLERAGYEVRTTGSDPRLVRDVAQWGDLIILAVPFSARRHAIETIGKENLAEKTLIDVTNPHTKDKKFAGSVERSGAEELDNWVGDDCCVVKAFNTTFANTMSTGQVQDEPITLFYAGDDADAKEEVQQLGKDIGFDPVDAGDLRNARWLETLGYFNIQLGSTVGMGPETGFRYLHPGMARHVPRPDAKVRGRTERKRVTARTGSARTGSRSKGRTTGNTSTATRSAKKGAKKTGTTRRRSF